METGSHPDDARPQRGRAGATFAITGLATFMAALDNLVVTTALPSIQRDLDATLEGLQWTVNAYTLTFAVLLMTAAILGDRYGRRRVFILGLTLFMAASALAATAGSEQMLVAARALQGAGGSVIFPLGLTLLITAVPAQRRGAAIAGLSATAGLGIAVGPLIGGLVLQQVHWQWIFWLNVPIGAVLVPFAMRLLAESRGPHTRLDVVGTLLVSCGLLGVVYPLVASSSAVDWSGPQLWASLGAGLTLLVVFVVWEHRTAWPVIPPLLFRSRGFALSSLNALLIQGAMFGAVFLLVQYLQDVLAYPPADAGLRTLPWTLMPLLVAPLAVVLAARLGVKTVMVVSAVAQGAALVLFALVVAVDTAYLALLGAMVLAGFGMGLFFALSARQTLEFVMPEQEGVASGVNNAMRQVGVVLGIATLSSVFAAAGGRYGEPARFVDGLQSALWVGAAVLAVAVVCAALVPPRAPAGEPESVEHADPVPLVPLDRSSS
jgi:EmrB/QacA subfamily drug resistance transporter